MMHDKVCGLRKEGFGNAVRCLNKQELHHRTDKSGFYPFDPRKVTA